ncbi:MAG: hypothetical protein GXY07_17080 [Candidatus Hydrogenedentes bacterium]|nr:hypothetical protein [Candidatus Hydrogenedentota bacterium]
MQDVFSNILFGMFLCGIAVLAVSLFFYYQFLKKRAFLETARKLKFRYYYRSYAIPRRFAFLGEQRRGRGRHALNILLGRHADTETVLFDYCYSTGLGAEKKWHYGSFAVMHHGRNCPPLRVYPKSMLSELGDIIGYEEVYVDHNALSEKFSVFAANDLFAHSIIAGPLAEYLLRHPELSVEIDPIWLAVGSQETLIPEDIPRRLNQLEKIRKALPF